MTILQNLLAESKTKIVDQLNEEHEKINIDYARGRFSENPEAVDIHVYSSSIVFNFNKLPTKMELLTDNKSSDMHDWKRVDNALQSKILELQEKNKEAAFEFQKMLYKRVEDESIMKNLTKELSDELGVIFDHLNSILKAKVLTYCHDLKVRTEQNTINVIKELEKVLDAELAK